MLIEYYSMYIHVDDDDDGHDEVDPFAFVGLPRFAI